MPRSDEGVAVQKGEHPDAAHAPRHTCRRLGVRTASPSGNGRHDAIGGRPMNAEHKYAMEARRYGTQRIQALRPHHDSSRRGEQEIARNTRTPPSTHAHPQHTPASYHTPALVTGGVSGVGDAQRGYTTSWISATGRCAPSKPRSPRMRGMFSENVRNAGLRHERSAALPTPTPYKSAG